jgi:hypothetical protein
MDFKNNNDNKVLQELDHQYYTKDFDPIAFEINRLPFDLNTDEIDLRVTNIDHELDLINLNLSNKINKSYNDFSQYMTNLNTIQDDIDMSVVLCKNSHLRLSKARGEIKDALNIISLNRKSERLKNVIKYTEYIKQFLSIKNRINESLNNNDFESAITLVNEITILEKQLEMFDSVNITCNYNEIIKQKLYSSLKACCQEFNSDKYEKIMLGFSLIKSTETILPSLKQILENLTNTMTHNVVLTYSLKSTIVQNPEIVLNKSFKELCAIVKVEDSIPCFFQVLYTLSDLIFNFSKLLRWNQENSHIKIAKGLIEYRNIMWENIQYKLQTILMTLNIKDFTQIIYSSKVFLHLGEKFSGIKGQILRKVLIKTTGILSWDEVIDVDLSQLITKFVAGEDSTNPFSTLTFNNLFQKNLPNITTSQKKKDSFLTRF